MKEFARASGRLRHLPLLARVTYSVFIGFTLIALGFSAWLGADMLAPDLARFDEYYAGAPAAIGGEPSSIAPRDRPGEAGPRIELPAELARPAGGDPIPLRKLLEVTHFHLFSMPVYLMILSHLFMLSRWSSRAKLAWVGLGTLAVGAHIAAPWLARGGGAGAKLFYALSGAMLLVTFSVMSVLPLSDMWQRSARAQPPG